MGCTGQNAQGIESKNWLTSGKGKLSKNETDSQSAKAGETTNSLFVRSKSPNYTAPPEAEVSAKCFHISRNFSWQIDYFTYLGHKKKNFVKCSVKQDEIHMVAIFLPNPHSKGAKVSSKNIFPNLWKHSQEWRLQVTAKLKPFFRVKSMKIDVNEEVSSPVSH